MLNLKKYREALGISQAELARRLGMSRGRYNNYEHGIRTADYETLLKLSEALGCTVEDLIRPDDSARRDEPIRLESLVPDGETKNAPAGEGESVDCAISEQSFAGGADGCTAERARDFAEFYDRVRALTPEEWETFRNTAERLLRMDEQELDVVLRYLDLVERTRGD